MPHEIPNITIEEVNYERTDWELEYFLLFGICVAGKTAIQIKPALNHFLSLGLEDSEEFLSPFNIIRKMIEEDSLLEFLYKANLGQYTKLVKSFKQLVDMELDLKTCSLNDLLSIHGVGPKTARFFLCYNRPNQPYAILDTHILKYIKKHIDPRAPAATPSGNVYIRLEKAFVKHANNLGYEPVDLDLKIWEENSRGMV